MHEQEIGNIIDQRNAGDARDNSRASHSAPRLWVLENIVKSLLTYTLDQVPWVSMMRLKKKSVHPSTKLLNCTS